MHRRWLHGLLCLGLVLGCDGDVGAPPPLFEGIVVARDLATAGDLVLVANDVESALGAPSGAVPAETIHDLLVLSGDEDGLEQVGTFDAPQGEDRRFARRVAVDESAELAFLALGDETDSGAVAIVDLADPSSPQGRGTIEVGHAVTGLAAQGGLLATVGPGGLELFDVSDPDAPLPLGAFDPTDDAGLSDVTIEGNLAYVAGTTATPPILFLTPRMLIVDLGDPEAPVLLGEHRSTSGFQALGVAVEVRGARAYLLADLGIDVVDVSDPRFPYGVGGVASQIRPVAGLFTDLEVIGTVALAATRAQGVSAIDLGFPPAPALLGVLPGTSAVGSRAASVAVGGRFAHVALDRAGIRSVLVDDDADRVATLVDVCPGDSDPEQADVDLDGVGDACDLCIEVWDPAQVDADADGYGNRCDADLDGSGFVDFDDYESLRASLSSADPVADLDGNGVVDLADLARMRRTFFAPPGPSARASASP